MAISNGLFWPTCETFIYILSNETIITLLNPKPKE